MPTFANRVAFEDPKSRAKALGFDLDSRRAIVDPGGRVLAYAQTGGMSAPSRYELLPAVDIYRFGSAERGTLRVAAGQWWVERPEFEKLRAFAQTHDLGVGMAMRLLGLVPPEWSDMTLLVRARVREPLLALRGLAQSVTVAKDDGGAPVRLPDQNQISARRMHQLFIPGLDEDDLARRALAIEGEFRLSKQEGLRGFLYL